MDDLERALSELAERGHPRGARRVFDDASSSQHDGGHRRNALLLAAAAVLAVLALGGAVVLTRDDPQRVEAALLAVVEPSGTVPAEPFSGIGDVLVGAGDGPSVLWSDDRGRTWHAAALGDAPAGGVTRQLHRDATGLIATVVVFRPSSPADSTDISAPPQRRVDVYQWRSTDGVRWSGPTMTTDVDVPPQEEPDGATLSESVRRAIDDLDLPGRTVRALQIGDDLIVPIVDTSGHLIRVVAVDR